jgi:molybdate transport system permease protein
MSSPATASSPQSIRRRSRRPAGPEGATSPLAGLAILAALGLAFVALPIIGLAVRAPWGRAGSVLTGEFTLSALRVSLRVSLSATALALLLGFPLAWVLARTTIPGRAVVRALVILPLVLPPVVGGVALFAAFGRRGLIGRLLGLTLFGTPAAATIAAAFVSMPLLILAVEAGLRSLDPRLEGAASTMGASRWYVLRRITLPLLAPQLAAGLVLTWARALGEFGATITFAGNLAGRTQTLPLAVFERLQTDPDGAVLVSLVLVVLSVASLAALRGRVLR